MSEEKKQFTESEVRKLLHRVYKHFCQVPKEKQNQQTLGVVVNKVSAHLSKEMDVIKNEI